jgi:integrase
MPRPNTGPRLVGPKCSKGSNQPVYWIRWFEGGRKRERSTGTGERTAAERELQKHIERQHAAQRKTGPSRPDELTIAEALNYYLTERAPELADSKRVSYAVDALLTWWGDRVIADVKGGTCKRYARERGVSAGTSRRELEVLRSAIVHCFKEGYLTEIVGVTMPEKPAPKERWLTRKEAAALLRAARRQPKAKHLILFILIGLYTGARRDAILSLQWLKNTAGGHVDLEAGRINFNPAGRKQTKKRRPEIRIPKRLLRFLKAARKRSRQYVVEYEDARVVKLRRSFATACRAAKLGDDVTPHTLRHTCATWMAQRRVPIFEAAGFLGMTEETFDRVYAKKDPDYQHYAVTAFDRG